MPIKQKKYLKRTRLPENCVQNWLRLIYCSLVVWTIEENAIGQCATTKRRALIECQKTICFQQQLKIVKSLNFCVFSTIPRSFFPFTLHWNGRTSGVSTKQLDIEGKKTWNSKKKFLWIFRASFASEMEQEEINIDREIKCSFYWQLIENYVPSINIYTFLCILFGARYNRV